MINDTVLDIQEALDDTKNFTIPMSEIKVLSRGLFEINGQQIPITNTAFKDLLKLVGLTNKTVAHLNDQIHKSAGFQVMKELMKAMAMRKGMNITLIIDVNKKVVQRICLEGNAIGSNQAISPSAIQDLINHACEQSDKVKLTDQFISDGGTKVSFNLKWAVDIPLSMRDENVSFGKSITWDLLGDTIVSDFAERLICSNGMTGIVPARPMSLDSDTTPSEWYQLLFKDLINPNLERVKHYENKVFDAMQTNLSIYEFNTIKAFLVNNWRDDVGRITRYLGMEDWKLDYKNRGLKLETLPAGQLKNCPTPVNAWDAINCITDLASHTYNTKTSDHAKKGAQRFAGKLLNSEWNENQQIENAPTYHTQRGPKASYFI